MITPVLEFGTASFRLRFHTYKKEPPNQSPKIGYNLLVFRLN